MEQSSYWKYGWTCRGKAPQYDYVSGGASDRYKPKGKDKGKHKGNDKGKGKGQGKGKDKGKDGDEALCGMLWRMKAQINTLERKIDALKDAVGELNKILSVKTTQPPCDADILDLLDNPWSGMKGEGEPEENDAGGSQANDSEDSATVKREQGVDGQQYEAEPEGVPQQAATKIHVGENADESQPGDDKGSDKEMHEKDVGKQQKPEAEDVRQLKRADSSGDSSDEADGSKLVYTWLEPQPL